MNLLQWFFSPKEGTPAFHMKRGNEFLYSGHEQYSEAIAEFSKVIELDEQCVEAYIYRGMAYYFCGELDLAGKDLHKSHELEARKTI